MIGKILADRYQITEVRDSGRVLVAEDTHRPGYPLCLIQRLQGATANPQGFQIAKLILEQRLEAIGRLGKFSQIPAVLTFFELDQGLYLIEEMVMGDSLAQELKIGVPATETRIIELVREILELLVYMHRHDVILRGLRPDNLIRRQTDGKLVVVNLLLLPPKPRSRKLSILHSDEAAVPEVSHIYMPPEQIQGNPIFNSNLYSLGMIALQSLTGLPPEALPDVKSHWHDRVTVSPKFRALLDRILANEPRDRYRSAQEALTVLLKLSEEHSEESDSGEIETCITRPHRPPIFVPDTETEPSSDDLDDALTHSFIGSKTAGAGNADIADITEATLKTSEIKTAEIETTETLSGELVSEISLPTVLNPMPNIALDNPLRSPASLPGTREPIAAEPLPPTQIQRKSWWRSKRIWGATGIALGLGSWLAWHFHLPQNALSAYHLNQGQEQSSRSRYKGAIAEFNKALHWDTQNSGAFFSRGYAFYQIRNFRQSLDDFTQVISLEPNSNLAFSSYFYRGNIRMSLGDHQGAARDYNQAIEVDGSAALAFVQRGQAENALGKSGNAIKSYSQAIRLEPNLAAAYLNRCLTKSNLNDQPGAISDCTEATGINPNLLTAYQNRGLAYHRAGNYKQAIADLNVAIKLDGEDATSYYQRGLIRLDLQDNEGAIGDFNTAIQFKSDHVFAYYQRGLVQKKYGKIDEAIGDLEMAMKLCVEQAMTGCYKDAQYQLKRLGKGDIVTQKPKDFKNSAVFSERYTTDSNVLLP